MARQVAGVARCWMFSFGSRQLPFAEVVTWALLVGACIAALPPSRWLAALERFKLGSTELVATTASL